MRFSYVLSLILLLSLLSACTNTGGQIEASLEKIVDTGSPDGSPEPNPTPTPTPSPTPALPVTKTWDFSSVADYSFKSTTTDVSANSAKNIIVNTNFNSADSTNLGNHIGTFWNGTSSKLTLAGPTSLVTDWAPEFTALKYYFKFENTWDTLSSGWGTPSFSRTDPKLGNYSAYFPGASGKQSGSVTMSLPDGYTAGGWVKIIAAASNSNLFQRGDQFQVRISADAKYFSCYTKNGSVVLLDGPSNPDSYLNTWTYVICTLDPVAGKLSLYVNGVLASSINTSLIPPASYTARNVVGSYFQGYVDDVTLWNKPLTAQQIRLVYDRQRFNYASALSAAWTPHWNQIFGYWKMDSNWLDSSSAGTLSGTVAGSATFETTAPKMGPGAGAFNGASSVATNSFTQDLSSGFSVGGWVYKTSGATALDIIKKSGTYVDLQMSIDATDHFVCRFQNSTSDISYTSTEVYAQKNWYHVFCVLNPTTQKLILYIDGALVGQTNTTAALPPSENSALVMGSSLTGRMDDFAVWAGPLSSGDIRLIYERQKQKYSGIYESPMIEVGANSNWDTMTPSISFPYNKELSTISESNTDYSEIAGSLMTDIVGIWHLNEASGTLNDSSGLGNHAASLTGTTQGVAGQFSKAVSFDGVAGYVSATQTSGLPIYNNTRYSISMWVKGLPQVDKKVFSESNSAANNQILTIGTHGSGTTGAARVFIRNAAGTTLTQGTTTRIAFDGTWHHIMWVDDNGSGKLYIDGISDLSLTYTKPASLALNMTTLGACIRTTGSGYYAGAVDEVAVWKRALSDAEIKEVYRRGATRVKYQVRSCTSEPCSDDFKGPDGTSGTFYSELTNNTTLNASGEPTGSVIATPFSMNWLGSQFAMAAKPADNRYFQYRVYMESDDTINNCNSLLCVPEVAAVKVTPDNRYYHGAAISNSSAIAFTKLNSISNDDPGSCATYQISTDAGSTWKWWNGSAWATTTQGVVQSNSISDFTTARLALLPAGNLKFKALLNTNPTGGFSQQCTLNKVEVEYMQ